MFIDLVEITVSSGKGGDGIVAFRREKYVPFGGPAGGTGGRGGSVYFIGDENVNTLIDLKYTKHYHASNGENGKPKKMDGANGEDLYIKVPVGTVLFNKETNEPIGDITKHNQTVIVAKGGRGGRGNVKFTTPRNTAPEIAEKGEPGNKIEIRAELKLIADVGLVGFPSVGKSTIISVISNSKPKIASYHFTTITPNLGVVRVDQDKSFVVADLPGLIEGASSGQGLGHQFLRHIERTRIILHVLDMSGLEGRNPIDDFTAINNELSTFNPKLLERPQIIIANKMDIDQAEENLKEFKKFIDGKHSIIPISAYTKSNLNELIYQTYDMLSTVKEKEEIDIYDEVVYEYTFKEDGPDFMIELGDDGVYEVKGNPLHKIFLMTDFTKDQSVKKFSRTLRAMGVDQALRDKGVKSGDTVRIFEYEFDFID
jgi:GTP-binding protein